MLAVRSCSSVGSRYIRPFGPSATMAISWAPSDRPGLRPNMVKRHGGITDTGSPAAIHCTFWWFTPLARSI